MLTATTSSAPVTTPYAASASPSGASAGLSFSKVLANTGGGESLSKHVFRNGQISVDMHADGQRINSVSYYDASGQKLTNSGFWPQDILRNCEKFNIPLTDLQGIGTQLDAAGVGYRPYEQYAGTGSNHGIDFDNLVAGGMGTAYDWTADPLVHLKGPAAADQLKADQALAERLGLKTLATETASTSSTAIATSTAVASSAASSSANNHTPASPVAALDELLQLITQVKASLQSAVPTAAPASTATVDAKKATSAPATQPVGNTSTTQRLAQMKSLLDLLIAAR